jgi:hypothetical protein
LIFGHFVPVSRHFAPAFSSRAVDEHRFGAANPARTLVAAGSRVKAGVGWQQMVQQRLSHSDGDHGARHYDEPFAGKTLVLVASFD